LTNVDQSVGQLSLLRFKLVEDTHDFNVRSIYANILASLYTFLLHMCYELRALSVSELKFKDFATLLLGHTDVAGLFV
jgi:hypothetical protein